MNISGSTGSSIASALAITNNGQTPSGAVDADGDHDGSTSIRGGQSGRQQGHALRLAISQTLQQLGLTSRSAPAAASGSVDRDGDNDGSGSGGSTQQALHTFLHDLVQAARNGAGTPTGKTGAAGYGGDLQTNVQNLVQSLGTDPSADPTLSKLTNDFQALLQSANGGAAGASDATGTAPTLQGFLQKLVQNLGTLTATNGDPGGAVGNLVSTSA